jgi:hypothetical protein
MLVARVGLDQALEMPYRGVRVPAAFELVR